MTNPIDGFILRPRGYTRWRIRTRLMFHHLLHPFEVREEPGGTIIRCTRCNCLVAAMVGAGFHLTLTCNICGRSCRLDPSHRKYAKLIFECECGAVSKLTERAP